MNRGVPLLLPDARGGNPGEDYPSPMDKDKLFLMTAIFRRKKSAVYKW